jgi:hypothetical protein
VFSCLGRGTNPLGLREYLVVQGKARVTEGGAPALLQRLARLYFAPTRAFHPSPFATSQAGSLGSSPNGSVEPARETLVAVNVDLDREGEPGLGVAGVELMALRVLGATVDCLDGGLTFTWIRPSWRSMK